MFILNKFTHKLTYLLTYLNDNQDRSYFTDDLRTVNTTGRVNSSPTGYLLSDTFRKYLKTYRFSLSFYSTEQQPTDSVKRPCSSLLPLTMLYCLVYITLHRLLTLDSGKYLTNQPLTSHLSMLLSHRTVNVMADNSTVAVIIRDNLG